jgi:hypothetical protein
MKTIIGFAICAMLTSGTTSAQTLKQKTFVKAVTLWDENTYKLNGGARSSLGGTSRKAILINLPANTIEWFYSITTSTDGSTTNDKINLGVQIATAIAAATTGIGKAAAFTRLDQAAVNAIKLPTGSMPINSYVLDNVQGPNFLNKKSFSYQIANEDLLQGTTRISYPTSGSWYIGIQNPSAFSAVNFKIEVVAIIRETKWVVE